MTIEAVYSGKAMLMVNRRPTPPIAGLGPRQQQWLEARFPGISRNRVQRLEKNVSDHERAAAAYRIGQLAHEEATKWIEETVYP